MGILNLTLTPEAVGKFYESLVCLGKFSEAVAIEATRDRLFLNSLNSTRSAYACFTFLGNKFFTRYSYTPPRVIGQAPKDKFTCRIHNKALVQIFKGRTVDPAREKDTSIEKCEIIVEDDPGEPKSRFIIRMICRHGVLKTYRLTFESVPASHAVFDTKLITSRWGISSRVLREFVEHFAPKTEQLDIYLEDGRANFTSYTEKVVAGGDVLKQPLHTTIAIDTQEFGEFSVEEKLHIVISVKDFKAIVTHAGITNTVVSAAYSHPLSPMQLKYNDDGMICEFVLMTIGDYRGPSSTPGPGVSRTSQTRSLVRQPLEASSSRNGANAVSSMLPPPRSAAPSIAREAARARTQRPSPPPPTPSLYSNALFCPEEDDDHRWDPEVEEPEEMLGWDTSADNGPTAPTLSYGLKSREPGPQTESNPTGSMSQSPQRLSPTQRVSQIHGIFD